MIAAGREARHVTGVPARGAGDLRALVHSRHAVPSATRHGGRQEEQTMFYTRGSTLQSTVEYLRHALEPKEFEAVLARLSADERWWSPLAARLGPLVLASGLPRGGWLEQVSVLRIAQ